MGAFGYFVEGAKAPVTREQIAAWGLAHAFDGVPNHTNSAGPNGTTGVLLWDVARLDPYQPVYDPELQSWHKAPAKFAPQQPWYVGHYKGQLPTAADLVRDELVEGLPLELAGQQWVVPVVRSTLVGGESWHPLPCYLDFDEEGEPVRGDVVDEHAWLLECVAEFWDAWLAAYEAMAEGASTFSMALPRSTPASAARLLSANYRIGPVEAGRLRLFRTDGDVAHLMQIACDCLSAVAFLKKKAV